MAVYGMWLDASQAIYIQRTEGIWTATQYAEALPQFSYDIARCNHMVHVISDFSQSHNHPRDLLMTAYALDNSMPRNVGVSIMVSQPPQVNIALQVMKRMMPHIFPRLYFMVSLDEAMTYITHIQSVMSGMPQRNDFTRPDSPSAIH